MRLRARLRAVTRLQGWRRFATAFTAGAFGALAMAPFGIWPAFAVSFPLLVLLLDGSRSLRSAAAAGWWFGFGYFLASLWWIGAAFLVDARAFAWLLPVAVLALPAGLALFTALGAGLAYLLWSRSAARLFAFAFAFAASEWLRGHVLTGFPWNAFGYALAENLALMQSAAVVGLWGLTFLALLLLATPALLVTDGKAGRWAVAGALLMIAGAFGAGEARLAATPTTFHAGARLRIMQPNLPQDEKFAYGRRQPILEDYLVLSRTPSATYPGGLSDVAVLIWPESALPFIYEREPWAREMIAAALPQTVTLITGAARYGAPPRGQTSPFFNSVRVMDSRGTVLQTTDKVHLVPFGEYLPFQAFLESLGIEQLTRVRGGFSAGSRIETLKIPDFPSASPLVCYEAIFPGEVMPADDRPGFLLNVTNDGWFGHTSGPYQHFAQARLRAVEEGLPLVRAANTGISAVIDPLGRIVASEDLGRRGVVDALLPRGLPERPFAGWNGTPLFGGLLLASLAAALLARIRGHARRS